MILSARFVRKPRKSRNCFDCGKAIDGHMIRLYGAPDIGDRPYLLYAHAACIADDPNPKVKQALSKAGQE